jgi:large subunit ribosomal protein L30
MADNMQTIREVVASVQAASEALRAEPSEANRAEFERAWAELERLSDAIERAGLLSGQVQITLKRSTNGRPEKQKLTARALGLTKLHQTVIRPDTDSIWGMIRRIEHLVEVKRLQAVTA